jgi:hypothetical protein
MDTLRHALTRQWPASSQRSHPALSFEGWEAMFGLQGLRWPTIRQTLQGTVEDIGPDFEGLSDAFKRNGILYAAMATRQLLMSEARFQFQELRGGVPGDLFGNEDLAILENPWPNAQTADLISRAVQDVDLAGNFFAVRRPGRIRRLRPDWMTIILGSGEDPDRDAFDIDAEVIGYAYHPGGYYRDLDPVILMPEEVCHWAPIPDPTAGYRGMSWITPIIQELRGDSAARDHKVKFFENGATTNLAVGLDVEDPEKFTKLVEAMDTEYKGLENAYRTLYYASATANITPIGKDFQQMDFRIVQSAGENRIATAAGLHPVILGLSDSLQGSSLNTGNFTSARRLTADKTLRPLWAGLAGSLQSIIKTPSGSRLWYDDRNIPFLADDVKDAAEVRQMNTSAMRQLIDGGFEPDSVVDFITSGDYKRLNHSGLTSVQLLPPGTVGTPNTTNTPNLPAPEKDEEDPGRSLMSLVQLAALQRSQQVPMQLTIEDGAFRVETPITFPEGFVRSETTIEPAQVTIEEGAVTIAEGAIHSETPITVHPAEVTIADGAMRSETTVNPPKIEELTIDTTQFEGALQELRDEIRAPRSKKIIRDKDNVITEVREDST